MAASARKKHCIEHGSDRQPAQIKAALRLALVVAVTCLEYGCSNQLAATNPAFVGSGLGNAMLSGAECLVFRRNTSAPTAYLGPDGRPARLTAEQCRQVNEEAQLADPAAQQQRAANQQRAAEEARAVQEKRAAVAAQVVRDEEARGYKHVTMKDLLLDGRSYAASETKIAISGFYKLQGRRDERLYTSYDDLMMHTYQTVEARYVGLLTENGTRNMREYLLRCVSGCNITILGHVSQCVATTAFGASSSDFCLVADDMRSVAN